MIMREIAGNEVQIFNVSLGDMEHFGLEPLELATVDHKDWLSAAYFPNEKELYIAPQAYHHGELGEYLNKIKGENSWFDSVFITFWPDTTAIHKLNVSDQERQEIEALNPYTRGPWVDSPWSARH